MSLFYKSKIQRLKEVNASLERELQALKPKLDRLEKLEAVAEAVQRYWVGYTSNYVSFDSSYDDALEAAIAALEGDDK